MKRQKEKKPKTGEQALEKDYPVEINEDKLKTLLIDIEKSEENKNEKDNE